jgi:hypothetical protein
MITQRISPSALALGALALIAALAPAPQAPEKVGPLRELAEARAKVCERMLDFYRESLKAPVPRGGVAQEPQERYAAGYEPIELWSRRLVDAKLDAAKGPGDRVAILAAEVERIKKFAADVKGVAAAEPEWKIVADKVEFYLLDAEYRLEKEKAGR